MASQVRSAAPSIVRRAGSASNHATARRTPSLNGTRHPNAGHVPLDLAVVEGDAVGLVAEKAGSEIPAS